MKPGADCNLRQGEIWRGVQSGAGENLGWGAICDGVKTGVGSNLGWGEIWDTLDSFGLENLAAMICMSAWKNVKHENQVVT